MSTTLVIGGNRGIGFALVQEVASRDPSGTIFATTRNPDDSQDLKDFAGKAQGKVVIVKLDMINEASVEAAVADVAKHTETLDTVYINSGVMLGAGPVHGLKSTDLLDNLNANVVGPHNMFKAFSPMVIASKSEKRSISVTSSLLGSLGTLPQWGPFVTKTFGGESIPVSSYAVSKTSVNALVRQWADYLEPKGIAVIAVHPGAVATRMGEKLKDAISPAESARGFVSVVEGIDISKTDQGIYSYDGSVIPW